MGIQRIVHIRMQDTVSETIRVFINGSTVSHVISSQTLPHNTLRNLYIT